MSRARQRRLYLLSARPAAACVVLHGGSLAYRATAEGRPHAFVVTLPR